MSAPDPRRDAFAILRRVEEAGAYASVLLERTGDAYADPRDGALLTEIVYGVLRRRRSLDHAIGRAAARPIAEVDRPVLSALRVGAYSILYLDRIPDFAAVDTAVRLAKEAGSARAAGFVNGVLRAVARSGRALLPPEPARGDVAALALRTSNLEWWTSRVVARLGWDEAARLLEAHNAPADATLSPAPRAGGTEGLASALTAEDVATRPGRFDPAALRVVAGVPQRTRAFRDGLFWIQDEGSRLAAGVLGPTVGPRVADLCAAPGGKTALLASRLAPGGVVVAADLRPGRLRRLVATVRRLGLPGVRPVALDARNASATLAGPFDEVLVDAPCSGTGTLRRHPEIRYRLEPAHLSALAARQRRILEGAAPLVAAGGRLAYAVCSMEPDEGEEVVASFLAGHPEFERADPRPYLPDAARACVGRDLALRTTPLDDGMDGFFAALLTRRGR